MVQTNSLLATSMKNKKRVPAYCGAAREKPKKHVHMPAVDVEELDSKA